MKLSETVFLGLMLAMLAVMVTVSGKPKTYLIETVDDALVREAAKKVLSGPTTKKGGGATKENELFKTFFFYPQSVFTLMILRSC